MDELTAWGRLQIVHNAKRPNAFDYISKIFDDFFEMQGDRLFGNDPAVVAGVARFRNLPITVVATVRGKDLEQNKAFNFAMAHPEGYRKALRQVKLAEKFGRPVVCLIDIPGAFCGVGAEERGQGQAIAQNIMEFMGLKTPIIGIITGEGGSGGALGLAVCDELGVLENAVYSVISPQGAASIIWRDPSKAELAANVMKITAKDLIEFEVADKIIAEPTGGAHKDIDLVCDNITNFLTEALRKHCKIGVANLLQNRYNKFRKIGIFNEGQ